MDTVIAKWEAAKARLLALRKRPAPIIHEDPEDADCKNIDMDPHHVIHQEPEDADCKNIDMDPHHKTVTFDNHGYIPDEDENKHPTSLGDATNTSKENPIYVADGVDDSNPSPGSRSRSASIYTLLDMPPSWDVFEETPVDNFAHNNTLLEKLFMILLKTVVSLLLFILVLGSAVTSRLTLLEMVQQLQLVNITTTNKNSTTYAPRVLQVRWIWALFYAICFPYCYAILKGLWKIIFKKTASLSKEVLLLNILAETLHSFGLLMLIFIVLASIDPVRSSVLIYGVGLIPSLLDCVPTRGNDTKNAQANIYWRYMFKALIIAVAVLIIGLLIFFYKSGNYPLIEHHPEIFYIAPISLGLISLKYWSLFSDRVCSAELAERLDKQKTKVSVLVSILKIGYALLFVYVLYGTSSANCGQVLFLRNASSNSVKNCGLYEVTLSYSSDHTKEPYIFALINIITGYICFRCATIACQLLAQRPSFSLPLVLTGPISTFLVLVFTSENVSFLKMAPRDALPLQHKDLIDHMSIYYRSDFIFLIGFYLSFLFVTRHVWIPRVEKLAKDDKLFTSLIHSGVLLDQSIILNRRRDNANTKEPNTEQRLDNTITSTAVKMIRLKDTPLIYACATMWHENENEMMQLLKSIFRMDLDQATRRYMKDILEMDKDYYEYEAHIFFDDAFDHIPPEKSGLLEDIFYLNTYVKQFLKLLPRACQAIHENLEVTSPKKIKTPYGGRFEWDMPGSNKLVVHLKNKRLVRHKKRWSQVMYMYYFLGQLIAAENVKTPVKEARFQNTFLLALDGDVDFQPSAVILLVDRMTRNPKVGAACGRIHPIGTGPMVWYQKFEYAVSHWLQKSTEHMIGCVLCSPGCFSLFRGSALRANNVLRRYTTLATEAKHKVQYDQGEDRWLCTLLLQQGFRVEYCAASDALTYCPETFNEFFKQRRRWAPSTMANIMDLLMDWRNVRRKNDSISLPYIIYQSCLMITSILTPGTVFMLIVGALHTAYGDTITLSQSLGINLIPVILMLVLCYLTKEETQLQFASVMSLLYALLMMLVMIGLIREIATNTICSVTTILFSFVSATFLSSAILHPKEFSCLLHGLLYFVLIPSMNILLMFYALGNLQNVSWGTRVSVSEQEATANEAKKMAALKSKRQKHNALNRLQQALPRYRGSSKKGENESESEYSFSCGKLFRCLCLLKEETKQEEPEIKLEDPEGQPEDPENKDKSKTNYILKEWIDDEDLKDIEEGVIEQVEQDFWKDLIKQYIPPEHTDDIDEKKIKENLVALRNHVCMFFCLLNALFVMVVFTIEYSLKNSEASSFNMLCPNTENAKKDTNAITIVFLLIFGVTLLIQLIAMFFHRYETFMHILASIDINPQMMNRVETKEFWAALAETDHNQSEVMSTDSGLDDSMSEDGISSKQRRRKHRRKKKPSDLNEKMDQKFSAIYNKIQNRSNVDGKSFKQKTGEMSWMIMLKDPNVKKKWIEAASVIKKRQQEKMESKKKPRIVDVVNQVSQMKIGIQLSASNNLAKTFQLAFKNNDPSITTLQDNEPDSKRTVEDPNFTLVPATVHHDKSTDDQKNEVPDQTDSGGACQRDSVEDPHFTLVPATVHHDKSTDDQKNEVPDQTDSGGACQRDSDADQNGSCSTVVQKKRNEIELVPLEHTPPNSAPFNETDTDELSVSYEHSLLDSKPVSDGVLQDEGTTQNTTCSDDIEVSTTL